METLLREWTEHHKMKNIYGEIEEVEVTCKEFDRHDTFITKYAIGKSFGTPIYSDKMFCDDRVTENESILGEK